MRPHTACTRYVSLIHVPVIVSLSRSTAHSTDRVTQVLILCFNRNVYHALFIFVDVIDVFLVQHA